MKALLVALFAVAPFALVEAEAVEQPKAEVVALVEAEEVHPEHSTCYKSYAGGSFAISCTGSAIRFAAKATYKRCNFQGCVYGLVAYGQYVYQGQRSTGCVTNSNVCSPPGRWTRCSSATGYTCTVTSLTHVNESPHLTSPPRG